jgi:glucosyl-dolichyl phosphate glucuronosyltransferase
VDISVIIPTRNRAAFLGRALISLCEQTVKPSRYEICVVNNASTDMTAEVVATVIKNCPDHKIFLVNESVIGLSAARNAGIRATSAPLIAMSDDDATMPADWLERFLNRFDVFDEHVAKVGGEIIPVWGAPRPSWISDGMLPLLSAASGHEPVAGFSDAPLLEGNSCYRRLAISEAGGFPLQLGRKGSQLISGDHAVDLVILMKGGKLFFDPEITINHTIHADRLTARWIRQRYFWQGVSDYATRVYLQKMGISINHALKLELPLAINDWTFVNNLDHIPTETDLAKLRSLGLVLAKTGIIPVDV